VELGEGTGEDFRFVDLEPEVGDVGGLADPESSTSPRLLQMYFASEVHKRVFFTFTSPGLINMM
jgi:hypothetical protein